MPYRLRAPLRRVIYSRIPLKIRMGAKYWQLKSFLQEAQWWDRERIEAWQLEKLKSIVQYAYENTPGYRALYQEAGVKPDDIVTLADVRLLPFTTRELLRDNLDDFTARNIPRWRRRYVTTGGSTGIPFGFFHTTTNTWMENAFMHSGWERVGWTLGDSTVVLRGKYVGTEDKFWEFDTVTNELHMSSYCLTNHTYPQYISKIEKVQPKHLHAYPSAVSLLADLILDNNDVNKIKFDTVLLGSENVYEWQINTIKAALPSSRQFDWYGHTEQAILAPWCEYSAEYHIWPFYGLTEVLNSENMPVDKDDTGELVGTSFWNFGTPFIRYRTEDLAQYGGCGCPHCRRQFMLLSTIIGRIHHSLVSKSGRMIPLVTDWYVDFFSNVRQFQFYQDTPGEIKLRLVCKDSYSDNDTQKIRQQVHEKLGDEFHCEIELVDEIPRTQRGKQQFLEQKLSSRAGA